ncbi:MAG: hypothetical protein ACM3SR_15480 [Ignavibacteriales bacterium]
MTYDPEKLLAEAVSTVGAMTADVVAIGTSHVHIPLRYENINARISRPTPDGEG